VRELLVIRVVEVSATASPAYLGTQLNVRHSCRCVACYPEVPTVAPRGGRSRVPTVEYRYTPVGRARTMLRLGVL
jgi:hypothetical protein